MRRLFLVDVWTPAEVAKQFPVSEEKVLAKCKQSDVNETELVKTGLFRRWKEGNQEYILMATSVLQEWFPHIVFPKMSPLSHMAQPITELYTVAGAAEKWEVKKEEIRLFLAKESDDDVEFFIKMGFVKPIGESEWILTKWFMNDFIKKSTTY